MRIPFVAGNWKMNTSRAEAEQLVKALIPLVAGVRDVHIAVCPPFPYLSHVVETVRGSVIKVGAQNMHFEKKGAFTGEVSGEMLKDIGCMYVILGHSERRHIFGEKDTTINKKVHQALEVGLKPILCVGELLEEREAGKTEEVVENQIRESLANISPDQMVQITIAYEPVWAIGTGKTATPEQAQEVHRLIRDWLQVHYDDGLAQQICIQYGGSVKPENAKTLMDQPDIDGALVGGASLKADSFASIVKAAI
ncbi:triose-phosphate isomerase [bacterium]|nr:triose-phosphate isomerase [bacterium]RQV92122.1 MAG: triose-phosphate isomerase [bacterium]